MLEYVKRLLLEQTKLAAQFEAAPQPELREHSLHAETAQTQEPETEAAAKQEAGQAPPQEEKAEAGAEQSAEDRIRELSRQTMRMQSLQMEKTARRQAEQTKLLERTMTILQDGQAVNLPARTVDSEQGGLIGSWQQTMRTAGVASSPSQRSMQEISRFFERDARRYG